MGRTVLVALDEGGESLTALQWALKHMLRPMDGENEAVSQGHEADTVVLLHVKAPCQISGGVAGTGGFFVAEQLSAIQKYQDSATKEILSAAKQLCLEHKINSTPLVSTGDARDAICEAVEKVHADVLVMGSHGYGPVKRTLMGSVSDYCAHNAKCPVLIVKRTSKDKAQ